MTGQGSAEPRSAGLRPVVRAAITNLGCRVNQAEMDAVERILRARRVTMVSDAAAADIHVVNTCTVTSTADHKSRKAVRGARRASPHATIIVTGCSVQLAPEVFAAADPRAHLVDNRAKDGLVAEVERLLGPPGAPDRAPDGRRRAPRHGLDSPLPTQDALLPTQDAARRALDAPLPTLAGVEIERIADGRVRIGRTRAFIKVQDGCSFHCTYCIIPRARGDERSVGANQVLADVREALAGGHREIVLTGINVGTYDGGWSVPGSRGAHARSALTLAGLVRRILAETPVERIRLSSIEPQHVDDDLLEAWTVDGAGRCLPHFHLPLQSGDDGVLRRMGRRYDSAAYAQVVGRVRAALPRAAVHADVIVGFPTEDEAAFGRSLAFIGDLDLAGIHVFRYSSRPGTPATRMAGQVGEDERRDRAARLLAEAAASRARFAARALGEERTVLFEDPVDGGGWVGHAEDNVLVRAGAPDDGSLQDAIAGVRIAAIDPSDPERVIGTLVRTYPVAMPDSGPGPAFGGRE